MRRKTPQVLRLWSRVRNDMEPTCVSPRGALREWHAFDAAGLCGECGARERRAPPPRLPEKRAAAAPAPTKPVQKPAPRPAPAPPAPSAAKPVPASPAAPPRVRILSPTELDAARKKLRAEAERAFEPLGCGPDTEHWTTAWLLLVGTRVGWVDKDLADFAEVPLIQVRQRLGRMRRAGILIGRNRGSKKSRLNVECGDRKTGSVSFVLDVLVIDGLVERSGETGDRGYRNLESTS